MSNLPTGFIGYPEDPEYEMAFMRAKAERDRARTALVLLQELHRTDFDIEGNSICVRCETLQPCATRKLADEGLAGEEHG